MKASRLMSNRPLLIAYILLNKAHVLAIDLSIDNLAACVATDPGVLLNLTKKIWEYYRKKIRKLKVERGLYKTKDGKLINSDIHGAIGIAEKELSDERLWPLLAKGGA